MRKLFALAVLGMALSLSFGGCLPETQTQPQAPQARFKCEVCGAEFTNPETLQRHKQAEHPNVKP
jgi:hypothetical protein